MTIDALLYLGVELTDDDLALLVRDWRGWRGARRVTIGGPNDDHLTVWRGDVPVMMSLIRPGVYGDFLLTDDEWLPPEFAGPPPFRPRSILSIGVSTKRVELAHIGLRLVIELAADCARRWPCRLTNDWVGDAFRIYTEEEIIDAERHGRQLE